MRALNRLQTVSLRLLFLVIILLCSLTASLGIRRERMIDTWRPLHYLVNITLDDRLSAIVEARAEIEVLALKKVSHIDLDFGELTIDAVGVNANATPFEHKSGILDIRLPQQSEAGTRLTLTVSYHGKPKDGLILTPDKDGKPAAVGDNWPGNISYSAITCAVKIDI